MSQWPGKFHLLFLALNYLTNSARGLSFVLGPAQMYQMGVGFSGILFTHAVIESFHCIETSRSVFGLFNVPAKIYPFILLVILQVDRRKKLATCLPLIPLLR